MKTSKFENSIRQKLESISPDFHEDDWAKMQNYMHAHTAPTFWQQYGSWLGYAAAASVTTVMAFLYASQLSQNNSLVSDVKKLQSQIEIIKSTAAPLGKTDTIYIVQKELTREEFQRQAQQYVLAGNPYRNEETDKFANQPFTTKSVHPASAERYTPTGSDKVYTPVGPDLQKPEHDQKLAAGSSQTAMDGKSAYAVAASPNIPGQSDQKSLDARFDQLATLETARLTENANADFRMKYALANRLSNKQVKRMILAGTSHSEKAMSSAWEDKKLAKAEQVIPKLNLKVPYRLGGGIQFEGGNQAKTIVGEVLVSKKFSISSGLSWFKIKPMEFFTEKIFREKNRQDFKRTHPNEVPMAFEVLNINITPSLVQIPLTVAFRNDLKNDFTYYASAGTNITVKGREKFEFDCRLPMPGQQFRNQSFEKNMDIPLINAVNLAAGVEKSWHPIAIQVEGYLYSYFKPVSPQSNKTGPGVKFKLLYQIGKKM
jgi:hypothetical protein